MKKSSSIFVLVVALLVSSNLCVRNHLTSNLRSLEKEQSRSSHEYRPTSPWEEVNQHRSLKHRKDSWLSKLSSTQFSRQYNPFQFILEGTLDQQLRYMHGYVFTNNGSRQGQWHLTLSEQPLFQGIIHSYYSGLDYNIIALVPGKQTDGFQGSIYDQSRRMTGTFVFDATSNSKIQGKGQADPRQISPFFRIDINKSDLKGEYYFFINSTKYKFGDVEIQRVSNNQYKGQIKQDDFCINTFTYQSENGAGVQQFQIRKPIECDLGSGSTLLAKISLKSKMGEDDAIITKAVKMSETDTVWTYGEVYPQE